MVNANARILECTMDEYHADPCAWPSLSSSIANLLVSESPAHAWSKHPRLGGESHGRGTKAMDDGTLIHKLLLGKGKEIAVLDVREYRSMADRALRDEAIAAGKIPVKVADYKHIETAAEVLRTKLANLGFEFTGQSEVPVEWTDQDQGGGPVLCRSMWDHVFVDQGVIYDVKKVRSANPNDISRNFVDYGYAIQGISYGRALAKLRPELEGHIDVVFLFVEIEPPYSVVPARMSGAFKEIGNVQWSRALALWEQCLATNTWPGYATGAITLEAPPYVVARELGNWEIA